jgi:hypothetical protein
MPEFSTENSGIDKNTKKYGWAIDRTRFLTKILLTVNVVAGVRTVTN